MHTTHHQARLHELARAGAAEALGGGAWSLDELGSVATDLVCDVDGVYGNASPPWRSFSDVLFIGGGVGVKSGVGIENTVDSLPPRL